MEGRRMDHEAKGAQEDREEAGGAIRIQVLVLL